MTSIRVVGVDPGTMTGIGVLEVEDSKVRLLGHLKLRLEDPLAYLMEAQWVLDEYRPEKLVIEGQYLNMGLILSSVKRGQRVRTNVQSMIRVVEIRAWWEALAYERQLKVQVLQPQEWRARIFQDHRATDRKGWKARAKRMVRLLTGQDVTQDVAEAILIGIAGAMEV